VAQSDDPQDGCGTAKKPALRIWLDIGTKESTRAVPDARALRDGLISKGWQLGEDLAYFEAEDAEHTESAWAQRVGPMLKFLFPAQMDAIHCPVLLLPGGGVEVGQEDDALLFVGVGAGDDGDGVFRSARVVGQVGHVGRDVEKVTWWS
jgi:hypothetical protein